MDGYGGLGWMWIEMYGPGSKNIWMDMNGYGWIRNDTDGYGSIGMHMNRYEWI